MKFDPEGRVALVLGRKPEAISVRPGGAGGGAAVAARRRTLAAAAGGRWPAARRPVAAPAAAARPAPGTPGSTFNRPTDVAWDKAGNIYIADGIGNTNRIAKFDKDGKLHQAVGIDRRGARASSTA